MHTLPLKRKIQSKPIMKSLALSVPDKLIVLCGPTSLVCLTDQTHEITKYSYTTTSNEINSKLLLQTQISKPFPLTQVL